MQSGEYYRVGAETYRYLASAPNGDVFVVPPWGGFYKFTRERWLEGKPTLTEKPLVTRHAPSVAGAAQAGEQQP